MTDRDVLWRKQKSTNFIFTSVSLSRNVAVDVMLCYDEHRDRYFYSFKFCDFFFFTCVLASI